MDFDKIAKQYTRREFIDLLEKNEYGEKSLILKDDNGCFVYCPSNLGLGTIIDCKAERDTCSICWLNAIKNAKFKDELQEDKNTELSKMNNIKFNKKLWNNILLGKGKLMLLETEYKNFYDYIMVNKKLLKDLDNACINTYIANSIDSNIYMLYKTQSENKIILYSELFMKDIPISADKKYSASEIIHMMEENKLNDDDTIIDKENNEYTFSDAIDNWDLEGLIQFAPYKIKRCKYISWEDAIKSNKLFKYKTWKNFYEASEVIKLLPSNQAKEMINSNNWVLYNFNK